MKIHNAPAAEIFLDKLAKLHPVLHSVLDLATTAARGFFEERKKEVDSALFPDLVRYFSKELLQDPKYSSVGYILNVLSKNGLLLIYEQDECTYNLRMRKADEEGEMPVLSLSEKMKRFLKQRAPLLPGFEDLFAEGEQKTPPTTSIKLVIVWEVDSNYILKDVWLACFKDDAGSTHFVGEIPHSATSITAPVAFDGPAEELEDLDFSIKQTGSKAE
jgi:hypothetical protein